MKTLYDTLFKEAAAEYLPATDWRLLKAQGIQESQLEPNAKSQAGALGIMQFMPATWDEWSLKAGFKYVERTEPEASIFTGALYMRWLIAEWAWPRPEIDRYCLALASYNAGIGNLLKAQDAAHDSISYSSIVNKLPDITGDHARETIWYVKKILAYYNDMVTG